MTLDIDSRDGPLVLDFHSLRGTYATFLDGLDMSLKTRQELMRHSDPRLTMNRYTKVKLHDMGAAIQNLPRLSPPAMTAEPAVLRMTGTNDGRTSGVPVGVPATGDERGRVRTREDISTLEASEPEIHNPLVSQGVEENRRLLRTVQDDSSGEGGIL